MNKAANSKIVKQTNKQKKSNNQATKLTKTGQDEPTIGRKEREQHWRRVAGVRKENRPTNTGDDIQT